MFLHHWGGRVSWCDGRSKDYVHLYNLASDCGEKKCIKNKQTVSVLTESSFDMRIFACTVKANKNIEREFLHSCQIFQNV